MTPSPHSLSFSDLIQARVWNYWFAGRTLAPSLHPAADPYADDYKPAHALWFQGSPEIDAELGRHFGPLVEAAARGEFDAWQATPRGLLSLVLLLDQVPRAVGRGTARAFAHDEQALGLARRALDEGFDRHLAPAEALFFFLALVHSERLPDVRRALEGVGDLATRCPRPQLRLARSWRTGVRKHVDLLERFGRYPGDNAARGRTDTPAEAAFLARPEFTSLFRRLHEPPSGGGSRGGAAPSGTSSPARPDTSAPTAASTPPAPGGPRLRILALHGFRQNGEVFRRRTRKMRDALEDVAEFVFVTSPMAYAPRGDDRDGAIAAFGEVPDYPMQRAWWLSNEGSAEYEGFDASVAFLEGVFRAQGPFDGVLGFSQGGALAAVLSAMLPHPSFAFKFAICISAFPSRARSHATYVRPGGVRVPALHVLGLNDILVTPDRSVALFDVFDRSTSALVKHAGGHFVPNAWPYGAIRAFTSRFLGDAATPAAPSASAGPPPGEGPYERACEALGAGEAPPAGALGELAERHQWKELQALAMLAAQRSAAPGVHDAIVELFARQLGRDLRAAASLPAYGDEAPAAERARRLFGVLGGDAAGEVEGPLPSPCARLAPRIGSQTDKACRLARDVARAMFPERDMLAFLAAAARPDAARGNAVTANEASRRRGPRALDERSQAKHLAYQRYKQALSLLNGVLVELDPEQASRRARRLHRARVVSPEAITALQSRPLSTHVIEPEPEPVVPCTLDELSPLLEHLRSNAGVERQTTFHKGTLTTDGRLDLCKQVVGPEGIRPLLGAMMHSDRVKRLLLGNNVVGDGGAEAIASFIRERRDSPLECWYVAGNQIGPAGVRHLCAALAGDDRVTSLWLKRNPLKPEGASSLAALLRQNRTLEVLDVVNCGLLDEGLATLLGALRGPGANRTLKHLYVGTNGITERSAPLLAELLAGDCALESIYLSCNRLGDEGASALARALRSNATLRRLSLASNRVGPRGANALAEALAGHPSLELLDLGFTKATNTVGELGNFLGDEGARAIARMLAHNGVLRVLDLLHNFITQVGVNHLRDALDVNRSLLSLQLTQFGRVHNEPGKEAIRAALDRNRELVPPDQADRVSKIEFPDHVLDIYSVYRNRSLTPGARHAAVDAGASGCRRSTPMMLFRAPRPALRPFVRALWAIEPDGGSAPTVGARREHVLPAGTTHLAIRLSDHPLRVFEGDDDIAGRAVGLAVVGGARSRYYVRDVSQPACSVGAELEPGAAPIVFGAPADELAERHTPLEGLWGRAAAEARERLGAARSLAERLDVLEAILAARLPRARALHPAVAHALGRLSAGAEIGAIVGETGYSQRRFLDLFRGAVGLGPKVYGRVQRFQEALGRIASAPSAADAAAGAGYSDQAHMTREFRAFAGVSPGRYRALAPASPRHVPVR